MAKRGRPQRKTSLPLAKAISETIQKYCDPVTGSLPKSAADHGVAMLTPGVAHELAVEAMWGRLKTSMKRRVKELIEAGATPISALPFEGLFEAYTLAIDGERSIKRTGKLTRLEFKQAIEVRKKQLEDDAEALAVMERAYVAVSPIWDKHPEMLFEDVCRVYERQRKRRGGAA